MEMHQIAQFAAVANLGSMSEAAKSLNVSTSALSQGIKKLEASLGCELFDRGHTPLTLTEYGSLLLPHVESILLHSTEARKEIAVMINESLKKVHVGCFYNIITNSVIVSMAEAHPRLSFEVEVYEEGVLKKMLLQDKLDLIFVSDLGAIPGFRKIVLGQEEVYLSVPAEHKAARLEDALLSDLRGVRVVVPKDMMGVSEWYERLLESAGFTAMEVARIPVEQYFAQMNQTEMIHFRTSLMSEPIVTAMNKRSIRLLDEPATRDIVAYYPEESAEWLYDVIAFLSLEGKGHLGAMQSLSHLLHVNRLGNLTIQEG